MKRLSLFFVALLLIPKVCFGALAATTIFEMRSTAAANMVNGGGFNASNAAPGTDRSTSDTAYKDHNDLVIGSAGNENKVTSAAHAFTADDNGNIMHITAGTGFTPGWYEVVSVDGSNVATLDRACGTAGSTGGTYYLGGALNVGGSLEDDFFEEISGANAADGITVYFYNNNATSSVVFTLSEAVAISGAGGVQAPIKILGYKTTRGDNPTGNSRPTIACGGNSFGLGNDFWMQNLIVTSTGTNGVGLGLRTRLINVKSINSSSSAGRSAFNVAQNCYLTQCEGISYKGQVVNLGSTGPFFFEGCYFHDSNFGIKSTATGGGVECINSIFENFITAAVQFTGANTADKNFIGNTFFGTPNTTGIGFSFATGCTIANLKNNIISGFASGVVHADTQSVGYDDYNDYYNNDTDVANWTKGSNDVALDPGFTSVSQITGTAGAFVAGGSKLVDTSKNFTTAGVVAGQDCVYIVSGTGVTAGIYLIDSISTTTNANDTLNITIPASPGTNTTADKVYQITIGHNFAIGTNLKALGYPGAFPGGLTTGYTDIGAVQRQEPAGGGNVLIMEDD